MNVSRRTLLSGGVLGTVTAGVIGYSQGVFDSYEGDVWIDNRRATSASVELVLSNLDEDRTVLDESFTLGPDEDFRREGVFSNETRYRVTVRTGNQSAEREFETCCQGYQVSVYVERDDLQVLLGHYD